MGAYGATCAPYHSAKGLYQLLQHTLQDLKTKYYFT